MLAKRFFFVSAGILCLMLAYHLGAQTANAQSPGNPLVAADQYVAYTANGDVYVRDGIGLPSSVTFTRAGNVFSAPVPARVESWGQVKAKYR